MKICDLHTHSVFSDGTWTPAQLIDEAERIGLSAIALTDHNTVAGLPDFLEAARGREVEAIAGVEFSTDWNGTELHILGLFVRPEHYDTITQVLSDAQRRKDESNRELVENLNRAGYALDYDKIRAASPEGSINRSHIGAELTRLGYTDSVQVAFQKLLAPKRGYYHPPQRMTAFACIRFIRDLGALPVLAHPLLSLKPDALRLFLEQAVPCGLAGMETVYVSYDEQTTQIAAKMAQEFGLLPSGGSDFHAENKPGIFLGVGKGNLRIPLAFLEGLKSAL